ncbi:hypothetical protein M514_10029 [Trichuris suis]|uniref:SH3 domain-containing protein n=1 Tax=Trichuris suis TaxID=68888 RepID=A0A085NHC3_9BILA|nr:hypothetical protein M514_10029 [Trichuris suis]
MAVNLSRHRTELLQAYADILNEESGKNWMILSYEPNSSALMLSASGGGGLEEMALSFDCCKVQYGLTSLRNSGCSLTKVVLIHWQGESTPFHLLGQYGGHVREVERFFKCYKYAFLALQVDPAKPLFLRQLLPQEGIHLTHYARNEEDIDPDAIRSAVFKVTSGFGVDHTSPFVKPEPVGSVYRPVEAKKLIDLSERQKFWAQAEKEEAERQAAEQQRLMQNIASIEQEKQRLQERLSKECEERIGKVKISSKSASAINGELNSKVEPKIPPVSVVQPSKLPGYLKKKEEDSKIANDVIKEGKGEAAIQTECNGTDDTEISFLPGDTITHIDQVDPGWWYGVGPDKSSGLFPANYVKLLND